MRKLLLPLIVGFCFPNLLFSQNKTWSEDIAPILYKNCTQCHHDGGIGAFSLMDYSDAVSQAVGIKKEVSEGNMPPWPADPTYRYYAGERLLKPEEIDAIVQWVDKGTAQGDPGKAPQKPVYSKDSKLGSYDLKIRIPTYSSTAGTSDIYRCFSIPTNLTQNLFIEALEVVPGNPKIVHHVLVFQDTTNTTNNLDQADPLPGYTNFGGTGSNNSILMAGYVPGSDATRFPSGTGIKFYKNARVILQIHYPAGTDTEKDSTYVVFRYHTKPNIREVYIAPILNHGNILNGPLIIPKDQVKTFYQGYTVPVDVSLLSILPHMHLIGKSTHVFGLPPGSDTLPLIRIRNWDFHWQGEYKFQYVQKIKAGTKVQSVVTYDNTQNNPHQPSKPAKTVTLGEATTSEMMLTYFYYMAYQPGDENILQDSSLLKAGVRKTPEVRRLTIYPNPARDRIQLLIPSAEAGITITDKLGRICIDRYLRNSLSQGGNRWLYETEVGNLVPGVYGVLIKTAEGSLYTAKFVCE